VSRGERTQWCTHPCINIVNFYIRDFCTHLYTYIIFFQIGFLENKKGSSYSELPLFIITGVAAGKVAVAHFNLFTKSGLTKLLSLNLSKELTKSLPYVFVSLSFCINILSDIIPSFSFNYAKFPLGLILFFTSFNVARNSYQGKLLSKSFNTFSYCVYTFVFLKKSSVPCEFTSCINTLFAVGASRTLLKLITAVRVSGLKYPPIPRSASVYVKYLLTEGKLPILLLKNYLASS
jgi:hypothetical protein